MGILNDIFDTIVDVKSLGNDLNQTKDDFIASVSGSANEVKQTVSDTSNEIKNTASDIGTTVKEATDISPDSSEK